MNVKAGSEPSENDIDSLCIYIKYNLAVVVVVVVVYMREIQVPEQAITCNF